MKRIAALTMLFLAASLVGVSAQERAVPNYSDTAIINGVLVAQEKKADPPAKVEATKQPTEQWLKDYEEFAALQRAIAAMKAKYGIDKLEAELNTQGQALLSQVPAGYQFDLAKKQFIAVAKAETPKK